MILVDTGPLVALFDPAERDHTRCADRLRTFAEPLTTTIPVLTEVFHLLDPASAGARGLMSYIADGDLDIWALDASNLIRAFELMQQYSDQPMDLADASLVVAAEALGSRKVFTLDRKDFQTYRIRRGHRHLPFEMV